MPLEALLETCKRPPPRALGIRAPTPRAEVFIPKEACRMSTDSNPRTHEWQTRKIDIGDFYNNHDARGWSFAITYSCNGQYPCPFLHVLSNASVLACHLIPVFGAVFIQTPLILHWMDIPVNTFWSVDSYLYRRHNFHGNKTVPRIIKRRSYLLYTSIAVWYPHHTVIPPLLLLPLYVHHYRGRLEKH